jgi:hypothetical protein
MIYTREELSRALQRLSPESEAAIRMTLPKACEMVAADLFLEMDKLSDTDIQLSKDITILRRALRDLRDPGFFRFDQ